MRSTLRLFKAKPLAAAGAIVLLSIVAIAVLVGQFGQFDPLKTSVADRLAAPSWQHWFGLDELGRDIVSRVIYGSRTSLYVGVLATAVGSIAGTFTGAASVYYGGKSEALMQRLVDVVLAFPPLILALTIMAALGPSMNNVVIAIGIPYIARCHVVTRSAVLSIKRSMYVEASQALGCTNLRILMRHVLPNCLAPSIITATTLLSTAILTEASLSFLGVGVPPPFPSWGRSLSDSMPYMLRAPHAVVFPGIAISLVVFAANLLGDGIRDFLDPRLRTA